MQGTILIIDGVASNRMLLKSELSAACFQVVEADGIQDAIEQSVHKRPDLIVSAMSLPDGTAKQAKMRIARHTRLANVPMIVLAAKDCLMDPLSALCVGIDEVLAHPLDNNLFQARIRSLLRTQDAIEELAFRVGEFASDFSDTFGSGSQAEVATGFSMPPQAVYDHRTTAATTHNSATVALVSTSSEKLQTWKLGLNRRLPFGLRAVNYTAIHSLMQAPVPDVIVLELDHRAPDQGLRLVSDLRARASTRNSIVIAMSTSPAPALMAEALDRGAHDVLLAGFHPEELSLRISTQLGYKSRSDQLRRSLKDGLRAASEDPMTGLKNRRYAKPFLSRVMANAAATNCDYAVMMADLDHFKRVNDAHGHPAGDAVLIEAARRLRAALTPEDLLARVGGEEFMIVLPNVDSANIENRAQELCNAISATPFQVYGTDTPISVTISIGVVRGGVAPQKSGVELIAAADAALYLAKTAGRNQVVLATQRSEAA